MKNAERVNLPNSLHKKKSNYEVTVVLTILVEGIILQYIHMKSSCCISYTYSVSCELYHSKAGKKINKNMSFTALTPPPQPHQATHKNSYQHMPPAFHFPFSSTRATSLQHTLSAFHASPFYHRRLFCQMLLFCKYESPSIWFPI